MTYQQSVNTKSIAFSPSSLFFVIIKRDFISDYLNVPAFTLEFFVRALSLILLIFISPLSEPGYVSYCTRDSICIIWYSTVLLYSSYWYSSTTWYMIAVHKTHTEVCRMMYCRLIVAHCRLTTLRLVLPLLPPHLRDALLVPSRHQDPQFDR